MSNVAGDEDARAVFGFQEALKHGAVKKSQQPIIVTEKVDEDARFGVDAELEPCEGFHEFIERAKASGESEHGVCKLKHFSFTLVHGVGVIEAFEAQKRSVCNLAVSEDGGQDAEDFAAFGERSVGDGSHEADTGSAIDDADAFDGKQRAEFAGGVHVFGTVAGRRGAVDDDAVGSRRRLRNGGNGDGGIRHG